VSRRFSVCALLLTIAGCAGVEPLEETTTFDVEFESVDLPGRLWDPFMPDVSTGDPVTIDARLTVPATDQPVPGVIILHGCGGVGAAERGWVDDLVEAGYAALVVDSFGERGIATLCFGRETANVASIIVDLYRAAEALDDNEYIDGERLAVVGFSFGGRTAIWSDMARFQEAYGGFPFQAHIAFYPSTCFIQLEEEEDLMAPLWILHGTEDDWTPIDQCEDFIDRVTASGADARIIPYEGAFHGFDNETLTPGNVNRIDAVSPRACTFVERDGEIIDTDTGDVAGVGSTCVEVGITYGYDPAAHAAAKADLLEILSEAFGSGSD
jgi:dienelactone hydrolase